MYKCYYFIIMSFEKDPSITLDVFLHPSRTTALGMVCLYLAACGAVAENTPDFEPTPSTIVCEGAQSVYVSGHGKTYQGLIEAYVETEPQDHLKSDARLDSIAYATANNYDGSILFAYPIELDENIEAPAYKEVILPKSCNLI